MSGPGKCENVKIKDFNQAARQHGITAVDGRRGKDDVVDKKDTFVVDGQGRTLSFDHPTVRDIRSSVVARCVEDAGRAQRREEIADRFGVRFGESTVETRCQCEYVGVYSEDGDHLFNIGKDGFGMLKEEEIITRLEQELGQNWRTDLDMDFRAKKLLEKHGIKHDENGQMLSHPCHPGWQFGYDGGPSVGGYNLSVHMSRHDDNTLAISYVEDDGASVTGYLNLRNWTYEQHAN